MLFNESGETTVRYWDPSRVQLRPIGADEAVRETQRLVEAAVQKQVMSDVPVGVFVSGGLDSSILAALASKAIGVDRVHTFSAKFAEESFDESSIAEEVATQMRTRYVPVRTDEETLRDALENVTRRVAEPVADPAILPTFLLARAARERVTVILSGEGADELFGGYPTYLGHKTVPLYERMPRIVRRGIRALVERVPASGRKVTLEFLAKRFVAAEGKHWVDRHLDWFGTGLTPEVFAHKPPQMPELPDEGPHDDLVANAMLLDYRSYLRDNLLVKVDRATMLSSVEARAPYLDRYVTAFALSLPPELRVRRFTTKWVLKKAAAKWLPEGIIHRRKRGLSVPVAGWINGSLRGEVDRLLSRERLDSAGLNAGYVHRLLDEHRRGTANHAKSLWAVVMLEYWRETWAR